MKGSLLLFNLKLNRLIFFYQSKQLTDHIYADIYCKLSKCIGQTPRSYEHYLVSVNFMTSCTIFCRLSHFIVFYSTVLYCHKLFSSAVS